MQSRAVSLQQGLVVVVVHECDDAGLANAVVV